MRLYSLLGRWLVVWTLAGGGFGVFMALLDGDHLPAHWIPVILGAGAAIGGGIAGCIYGLTMRLLRSNSLRIQLTTGLLSGAFGGWTLAVYGLGITLELGLLGGGACGVLTVLLTSSKGDL